MADITITIDGKTCKAQEGEYILNIARKNNIFIPAICYLNNCSPTLACRMCLVDIDGKRAYACNAKAKDQMQVISDSQELKEERKIIMKIYDVNHPLSCGVCDQSGECELQNYTLEMGVSCQNFYTPDTLRKSYDWGLIHYDSSLCIVCERCVTVCKDVIGNACLKTIPRGGALLEKEWKDSMSKDSYAVWNKMQKSIIGKIENSACCSCGECAAVCPVGALVVSDFQYKSNAWELRKIPVANPHSSDCSLMYYDVKHTSIDNKEERIYRVSSDYNFSPLSGAARFGFDFENKTELKDKEAFKKIIEIFKNNKEKTIIFNSFITNEEAFILQKLKEGLNLNLVNYDALNYKNFLNEFSKTSGTSLYASNLDNLKKSDFIICLGSMIRYDAPICSYAVNNALKMNKGAGIYFHPIIDSIVQTFSKNFLNINHKPFMEEVILFWILDFFAPKEKLDINLSSYLSSFKKTIIKTLEENITEEVEEEIIKKIINEETKKETEEKEIVKKKISTKVKKDIEVQTSKFWDYLEIESLDETINSLLAKKEKFSLVVGSDLYCHKNAKNLANLLGLIQRYTQFEILIIPSQTNTLGVSLICDLDDKEIGFTIGYNEEADFMLSSLGNGDLDMPALNQQEGSYVSLNKRLVPTNAALSYEGYCLNDIANALGFSEEFTINYTKFLPEHKGFKNINFDDLPNEFENSGFENRGYLLDIFQNEPKNEFQELHTINVPENLIYKANPILQISAFTTKCHQLKQNTYLYVSPDFAQEKNIKDEDLVNIIDPNGFEIDLPIKIDELIKGSIPYLPYFDEKIKTDIFFQSGYRFANAEILVISNE